MKNAGHVLSLHPLSIEDLSIANNPEEMVLIFEQSYNKTGSYMRSSTNTTQELIELKHHKDSKRENLHVIVLVHGYQGTSWDMRMFRNYMSVLFPHFLYFCSSSNEGKTDGCIEEMGDRLAEELSAFLENNFPAEQIERISFVTHSLGGIIARYALMNELLRPYVSKLYTFFSLGSPHCGFIFSSTFLVSTGLWVMKKLYKSKCLQQLSLSDDDDPRKTFIYRLSTLPTLSKFKNIVLVSSPTDKYAPYHSVRMEYHYEAENDRKFGLPYQEMIINLHEQMKEINLIRFDVCFMSNKSSLDTLIGRAAHICFLDRPLYILMFLVVYEHLFR